MSSEKLVVPHIDLRAKLERLKRGLIADTVPIASRRYPNLKASQRSYDLKCGRIGSYDPLRRRSKLFRKAVSKFAPPYYFWLKEFMNSKKLKSVIPADEPIEETVGPNSKGNLLCGWCRKTIRFDDKDRHKSEECKKRREFLDRGYYECSSCSRGFIDQMTARNHVAMHFPKRRFKDDWGETQFTDRPKDFPIICRDQAKRKKWV